MKHLLLTAIAAVLVVGCGPSVPDISIYEAPREGNIEVVKQHIAAGTDVKAVWHVMGKAPLHNAAFGGHKEVVELLIAKGADVTAKDVDGFTPLDWTISGKQPETADLLRKHGAAQVRD